METISNLASTATTTVSNLIYGEQPKNNETAGKEPVSGEQGKGTVTDPFDHGNTESAVDTSRNNTPATDAKIEPTHEVEPTGSVQKPEDLIKAYDSATGDSTTATGTTGTTDKAGVTDKLWKPTDVDAVNPSVTDPAAPPETGSGLTGGTDKPGAVTDTLWRGVDSYKSNESATGATSTGSTITGTEPTRSKTGGSTSEGPKGAIEAEPKHYSVGDLTSGKDTTSESADTTSKPAGTAVSPPDLSTTSPDLSTTSPDTKPDYTADTQQPSHNTAGKSLASENAGHAGPKSQTPATTSVSPSGNADDDDEKNGKLSGLKDKLKTKLHIGHKDK